MRHLEPEDILRQALHQAAESVEPATDGLSRIRVRLSTPRPLVVAWVMAAWETVSQFVMVRLEPVLAALGPRLGTALRAGQRYLEPVTERLRPAFGWLIAAVAWLRRMIKPQAGSDERPPGYAWVRPVVAMAVVVLVAVVGGLAMSGLSSQIARDGLNVFTGQTQTSGGGSHSSGGVTGGGKHYRPTSGTSSSSGVTGSTPTASPSSSKAKAKATPTPTAAPTPTTGPTPTPTASPSPTPSPTPPPTPTPSPSGSGAGSTPPSTSNGSQSAQGGAATSNSSQSPSP